MAFSVGANPIDLERKRAFLLVAQENRNLPDIGGVQLLIGKIGSPPTSLEIGEGNLDLLPLSRGRRELSGEGDGPAAIESVGVE